MRNLRLAVHREEQALTEVETKIHHSEDVRQELQTLEKLQSTDLAQREELDQNFVQLDSARQASRLRHLRAEQERENRYRKFEHAKLLAVQSRFPQSSESARYILEYLYAKAECLVCGNHVPEVANLLQARITEGDCVVCGTDLAKSNVKVSPTDIADRRVKRANRELRQVEPELTAALAEYKDATREFDYANDQLAELDAKISERSARIDVLISRLPPDEQETHERRSDLAGMRSRTEALATELKQRRDTFAEFIDVQNRAMLKHTEEIMKEFSGYAGGFLLETVDLAWSPQSARVGQTGEAIQFPAFELDMTGADFPTKVRRTGPEQVSESQREFIDLAFRMSLMKVVSEQGHSSLIIDAPESSLDAVFVTRAADVLAKFADYRSGNRLTITSNLVEGDLVPELLKRSTPVGNRISRIVDLFDIAEPTAAIRRLGTEYRDLKNRLISKIESKAFIKTNENSSRNSRRTDEQ